MLAVSKGLAALALAAAMGGAAPPHSATFYRCSGELRLAGAAETATPYDFVVEAGPGTWRLSTLTPEPRGARWIAGALPANACAESGRCRTVGDRLEVQAVGEGGAEERWTFDLRRQIAVIRDGDLEGRFRCQAARQADFIWP